MAVSLAASIARREGEVDIGPASSVSELPPALPWSAAAVRQRSRLEPFAGVEAEAPEDPCYTAKRPSSPGSFPAQGYRATSVPGRPEEQSTERRLEPHWLVVPRRAMGTTRLAVGPREEECRALPS